MRTFAELLIKIIIFFLCAKCSNTRFCGYTDNVVMPSSASSTLDYFIIRQSYSETIIQVVVTYFQLAHPFHMHMHCCICANAISPVVARNSTLSSFLLLASKL